MLCWRASTHWQRPLSYHWHTGLQPLHFISCRRSLEAAVCNRRPTQKPSFLHTRLAVVKGSDAELQSNVDSTHQLQPLEYGVGMAQGPRELMEDCASVVQNGAGGFLFAFVFDGHSGTVASSWLNDNMYKFMCDTMTQDLGDAADASPSQTVFHEEHLEPALTKLFHDADHDLLEMLNDPTLGAEQSSGATATVGMIRRDKIIVANVGDTRAVLSRKGKAVELTVEHRTYGRAPRVAEEVARIEQGGGWVKNGRVCDVLAVSRSFGDRDFKGEGIQRLLKQGVKDAYWTESFAESVRITSDPIIATPDVTEVITTTDHEFLIIATDGLWDVFSSDEAVQLVRKELKKGTTPQECADKLVKFALKRYTADNVAVVVVELGNGAYQPAAEGSKKKGGGFWSNFGR